MSAKHQRSPSSSSDSSSFEALPPTSSDPFTPPLKKAKTNKLASVSPATSKSVTPSPSKPKGTSPAKTRLPASAKKIIAEMIIQGGIETFDLAKAEELTGLNKTQIRSQLVDNRQNLRKQMMDLAKSLQ